MQSSENMSRHFVCLFSAEEKSFDCQAAGKRADPLRPELTVEDCPDEAGEAIQR
jgi:hypothetical protein